MKNRTIQSILTPLILFGLISCQGNYASKSEDELMKKAKEIHARILTIDTHDDIPPTFATDEVDPGVDGSRQVDLPKMKSGGLDVAFFIVYVGQTERTPENYQEAKDAAMVKFNAIHRMTEEMYPDKIELAHSADDIERINQSGKLVACIGIENGYVIGKDLSLLQKYYDLGARYITLAHGGHNDICDSATPRENLGDGESEHNGVSEFGKEVIAEMNRLGIMVDVSHISKKAMLDAVALTKSPVIASHSSARALCDHPRNLDDEQLLALKENGGVMQTVAFRRYVKEDVPEKIAARDSIWEAMGITSFSALRDLSDEKRTEYRASLSELDEKWPSANVKDFVDHIDHAVKLIGIDHVGISSDFDGGGGVDGWNNAGESLNLTVELVRRGYSEEDIAKLWGGNLLRVLRENERIAKELQTSS
ncbi:dipeptidase [candidate division KSB1 bacterium]|nr:dipeptidase [candidate division KSB1 bacterium]